MALIEFKNFPDTTTPLSANNLNNNFNELDTKIGDVDNKLGDCLLKSTSNITSLKVKSKNGYGIVFIVSTMFTCVVQLSSNTANIVDVYGTHGTMTVSADGNNEFTLNSLYNWDHYIFIGSDSITELTVV